MAKNLYFSAFQREESGSNHDLKLRPRRKIGRQIMRSKCYLYVAMAVLLVVVAGILFYRYRSRQDSPAVPSTQPPVSVRDTPVKKAVPHADAQEQTNAAKKLTAAARRVRPLSGNADTPADAPTARLDDLLDDDSYDELLVEARKLIKHPDPEVRSRVAFALNWTGLKGLGDLSVMLGDPDPDVAEEARDYWKMVLSEIESPTDKAAMLDAAYTVTGDTTGKEVMEDILHEFSMIEDERVAAAHLIAMSRQSQNPEHTKMFVEAMDGISMPEDESESVSQAISSLQKWEREKDKEDKAMEDDVKPAQGSGFPRAAPAQPAATAADPAAVPPAPAP